ncbi:uncharacterized protein LOC113760275 [Coffea eugenioides]|uniref:uncharacterized protein LOC113760275 n=1 Tax=Coffea eugenioides TaxID=49369 RepID=UPI000F60EE0F|nr:uncharacterized protein LOC113760275 [Coffea eugenioides]
MGCHHLTQILLTFSAAALMISLSSAVTQNILYTICSQTQSEEICVRILESDPNTKSSTLPQLSLISINLTREQANKNYKIFRDLQANTTAGSLRRSYGKCSRIYKQMIDKINDAYQLSQLGRYEDIHQLGQAQTLAYNCENGLPSNSTTAADTESMILTCEAAASVNLYIASSIPES